MHRSLREWATEMRRAAAALESALAAAGNGDEPEIRAAIRGNDELAADLEEAALAFEEMAAARFAYRSAAALSVRCTLCQLPETWHLGWWSHRFAEEKGKGDPERRNAPGGPLRRSLDR